MKKLLLSVLLVASAAAGLAQSKLSAYTQQFVDQYKNATLQERSLLKSQMTIEGSDANNYVNSYIHLTPNTDLEALAAMGVVVNSTFDSIVTALIPLEQLERVAERFDVSFVEMGTPVQPRMDKGRSKTYLTRVHNGYQLAGSFKGRNVVVGVVDTGFEYGHINFYDSIGENLRVARVWDQNQTAWNGANAPAGYGYGSEFTTENEILNERYDTASESHGTHVAGIAAGADYTVNYEGAAPEAEIVLVSMRGDNTSVLDGVKYIYEYAESVGKPCVVNLSLGTHVGSHDGNSTFDRLADSLQGEGKLLVGSAGNEGDVPLHVSKSFTATDTLPLQSLFSLYAGHRYLSTDIWGEANKPYTVQVVVYDKYKDELIHQSAEIDVTHSGTTRVNITGAYAFVDVSCAKDSYSNRYNAYLLLQAQYIASNYAVGVVVRANDGTVHAWADGWNGEFETASLPDGWQAGNSNYTVGEIGGTGKRIITVGAYTTRSMITSLYGGTYSYPSESIDRKASFSSYGPTLDGRIKPNISAPGAAIISSFNAAVRNDSYYKNMLTDKRTVDGANYYYGNMCGTSMSSPMVAGILATWLEADPTLTPEDVLTILSTTALNDMYTGSIRNSGGSNAFGYGKIDAWSGIKEVIRQRSVEAGVALAASPIAPIVLERPTAGNKELGIFFAEATRGAQLTLFSTSGVQLLSQTIAAQACGGEVKVDLSQLTQGIYIVRISSDDAEMVERLVIQ